MQPISNPGDGGLPSTRKTAVAATDSGLLRSIGRHRPSRGAWNRRPRPASAVARRSRRTSRSRPSLRRPPRRRAYRVATRACERRKEPQSEQLRPESPAAPTIASAGISILPEDGRGTPLGEDVQASVAREDELEILLRRAQKLAVIAAVREGHRLDRFAVEQLAQLGLGLPELAGSGGGLRQSFVGHAVGADGDPGAVERAELVVREQLGTTRRRLPFELFDEGEPSARDERSKARDQAPNAVTGLPVFGGRIGVDARVSPGRREGAGSAPPLRPGRFSPAKSRDSHRPRRRRRRPRPDTADAGGREARTPPCRPSRRRTSRARLAPGVPGRPPPAAAPTAARLTSE